MAEKSSFEERMTDDLSLMELTEEIMHCAKCRHREGEVLSCGIYAQKPDDVVDGEICPRFEEE
jgi:hypothetical protein